MLRHGRKSGVFVIAVIGVGGEHGGVGSRSVLIVLFDGVQSLDVTGPLEVFAHAGDAVGPGGYEITTASVGGRAVRSGSGLSIGPDSDLTGPARRTR